jgi:hypothetical protein
MWSGGPLSDADVTIKRQARERFSQMPHTTLASAHQSAFEMGGEVAREIWQSQGEDKRREALDAPARFLPMVAETQSPYRYNEHEGAEPAEHYAFVEGFLSAYDSLLRQGFYLPPYLGRKKPDDDPTEPPLPRGDRLAGIAATSDGSVALTALSQASIKRVRPPPTFSGGRASSPSRPEAGRK